MVFSANTPEIEQTNSNLNQLRASSTVDDWNKLIAENKHLLYEIASRRKELWNACNDSSKHKALVNEMSRRDIIYWANNWVYGFDPRNVPERPALIPILLFEKQEEFLHWLENRVSHREPGLVEKCRDSGATFLCCIYAVHSWLYKPGFKATFGSRTEALVDTSDDPDSIFEKIRQIIQGLPKWMLPPGFVYSKHNKFMRIKNPATGAVITGEAGENMGRGGRATVYFKDESAHLFHPEVIEAAVAGNSDVVIDISTPNGSGNPFARKRLSGAVEVFSFNWLDDPRKSKEWYRKKKRTLDSVVFAQEIEISYSGSIENSLIADDWIKAAIALGERLPEYYLSLYNYLHRAGALDIADAGDNKNVYGMRRGIILDSIVSWSQSTTTQTSYRAIQLGNHQKLDKLIYDRVGVGANMYGILDAQTYEDVSDQPIPDITLRANFEYEGFSGQDRCSDTKWEAFEDRSSQEIFTNLRSEAAWILRTRFEKTYEYVVEGINHKIDDLIALPKQQILNNSIVLSKIVGTAYHSEYSSKSDFDILIDQLTQPRFFYTDRGTIRLESKKEMRSRGIKSPDHFDMLMMCYYDNEYDFDPIAAMNSKE